MLWPEIRVVWYTSDSVISKSESTLSLSTCPWRRSLSGDLKGDKKWRTVRTGRTQLTYNISRHSSMVRWGEWLIQVRDLLLENQGDCKQRSDQRRAMCMCVSVGTAVPTHMMCVYIVSNRSLYKICTLCSPKPKEQHSLRTKGLLEWSVYSRISNILMSFRNTVLILGFCIFVHFIFTPNHVPANIVPCLPVFSMLTYTLYTFRK